MTKTASLREKFGKTFPKKQADLFIDTFTDDSASRAQTREKLSGIRKEVHKLAESQKELAESQKELAEAQKQTDVHIKELTGAQKQTDIHLNELSEAQKRTEKEVRNLARQVGGLSEQMGGSLEDLALETVPAVLAEEWGMTNIDCQRGILQVNGKEIELDLILQGLLPDGSPLTILGEVKSNLTAVEVDRFLRKAEMLHTTIKGEMRVLFFGFRVNLEARAKIKKANAFMLFSNGRFLKILK